MVVGKALRALNYPRAAASELSGSRTRCPKSWWDLASGVQIFSARRDAIHLMFNVQALGCDNLELYAYLDYLSASCRGFIKALD